MTTQFAQAVVAFLADLQTDVDTGDRKQTTHRYYRNHLTQLTRWADQQRISLAEFSPRDMKRYMAARSQGWPTIPISPQTLHHDGRCAKAFFAWCRAERWLPRDPLKEYAVIRPPHKKQPGVAEDDLQALLQAVQDRWNPAKNPTIRSQPARERLCIMRRDYAILAVLAETAARKAEALRLDVGDYHQATAAEGAYLTFRKTKTDEDREIPITSALSKILDDWLTVRPKTDGCDCLFIGMYGDPLGIDRYSNQIKKYRQFAGLPDTVKAHALRRQAARRLVKEDFWAGVQALGHSDPKITKKHYLDNDREQIRAAIETTSPLRLLMDKRTAKARKSVFRK